MLALNFWPSWLYLPGAGITRILGSFLRWSSWRFALWLDLRFFFYACNSKIFVFIWYLKFQNVQCACMCVHACTHVHTSLCMHFNFSHTFQECSNSSTLFLSPGSLSSTWSILLIGLSPMVSNWVSGLSIQFSLQLALSSIVLFSNPGLSLTFHSAIFFSVFLSITQVFIGIFSVCGAVCSCLF